MQTPKISIIIPVYKVERYLDTCLTSILNQDEKNIEILVINDASPDNSEQIIDKYAQQDDRIKKINNPKNMGLGLTRNVGINEAKGEYILFVDSDDYLCPNVLSGLYNQAKDNDLDILQANYTKIYNWGERKMPENKIKGIYNGEDYLSIRPYIPVVVWSKLWKTSFLKKNNLKFNEWYFEDVSFSSEAYFFAKRVMESSIFFYNYRIRNGSIMTAEINDKKLKSFMVLVNVLEKHYMKSKTHKDGAQRLKLFAHSIVDFSGAISMYKKNNDLKEKAKKYLSDQVNKYRFEILKSSKLDIIQKSLFFLSPYILWKVRKILNK